MRKYEYAEIGGKKVKNIAGKLSWLISFTSLLTSIAALSVGIVALVKATSRR